MPQPPPRDPAQLARLRPTPRGWERSATAGTLIGVVNAALEVPKEDLPKMPRLPQLQEGSSAAAELLKVLLKMVAEQEGVAAKVLASSEDIDRLASDGESADVPALHGWRREVFGDRALQLVRGEIALKFARRRITVFDTPAENIEAGARTRSVVNRRSPR